MVEVTFVKKHERKPGEILVFKSQFTEAAERCGIPAVKDYPDDRIYRKVAKLWRRTGVQIKKTHKESIIIAANGRDLIIRAWPYRHYNIIPMLWDVWPSRQSTLMKDLKILGVKKAFVTVRSMAEKLSSIPGLDAIWIPEGFDPSVISSGRDLSERGIDVIELGRIHSRFHQAIEPFIKNGTIPVWKGHTKGPDGKDNLAFETNDELYQSLSDTKIAVSFPQCDTNPERAGDIETLTQRYWESMLSRCIMLGRAPAELRDLLGYNPVIDVNWTDPSGQIKSMLANVEQYQELVDKNYRRALELASWENRIPVIKKVLSI